jgi:hypothetical protein
MYETTKILSLMIHFVGLIAHGPIEYFDPLQSGHYPTRTIRKFKKGSSVGKRLGLGEQERRVSFYFGALAGTQATLEGCL